MVHYKSRKNPKKKRKTKAKPKRKKNLKGSGFNPANLLKGLGPQSKRNVAQARSGFRKGLRRGAVDSAKHAAILSAALGASVLAIRQLKKLF